jgi:hypothetical protein
MAKRSRTDFSHLPATHSIVMAGLVPAIHVFIAKEKDVDPRQRRQVYAVCVKADC